MRRKIILLPVLLLLFVAVVFAAGWYLLGNEAFLKQQLKTWVFDQTGRTIEVNGFLRVQPGSVSTIEAQDIRLSNASWASEPYMLEVGQLILAVDVMSLFGKRPNISKFETTDCQLHISQDSGGTSNWDVFQKDDQKKREPFSERRLLIFDLLHISNCHITDKNPARDEPLEITITEVSLEELDEGTFSGQAGGSVNGLPVALKGTFGPIQSLWQGGAFDHDVEMTIGKNSLKSSGSFTDILFGGGANVRMKVSGPEISKVLDIFALPQFSSGPFDLSLDLETKSLLTQVNLDGDLGSFYVTASGELDRILRPLEGNVVATAKGTDLEALGQVFDIEGLVPIPFDIKATTTIEKGEIQISPAVLETSQDSLEFSGEVGALPEMKNSNVEINIKTDELGRWAGLWKKPVTTLGPLTAVIHAETDASGLLSVQSDFQQAAGDLKIEGTLGTMPKPVKPLLTFDLSTKDFSKIGALLSLEKFPVMPLTASGNFQLIDSSFQFKPVNIDIPGGKLSYSGLIKSSAPYVGSDANLQLDIQDAVSFGALFGIKNLPDQPMRVTASLSPSGAGIAFTVKDGNLGAIRLDVNGKIPNASTPSQYSADVDVMLPSARMVGIFIPDQELPDLPLVLSGGFARSDKQLRFTGFHVELGEAKADIEGILGLSNHADDSNLTMSGSGPDLAQLTIVPQLASLPGEFSFSGKLSGTGKGHELQQFNFQLGQMKLVLNGAVDNPLQPQKIEMNLVFDVPDASKLNTALEQNLPDQPLLLQASYKGSFHEFSLSALKASLGDSRLKADLSIITGSDGKISGTIDSEFLDLRPWVGDQMENDPPSGSKPNNPAAPERLFPDELVTSVGDSLLDLDLDIKVDLVYLGNAKFKDVHIGVFMTDHQLTLDPLELSDNKGSSANGRFNLDALTGIPKMDIEMSGNNIRFGIAAAEGQDLSTYPPAEILIKLNGTGHTWHELASSVNGRVRVYQGAGLFASSGLDLFYSDFLTNLFSSLSLTSSKSKYTKLDCSVLAANFVDGDVKVDPIIFQTEHVTVLSAGTIDLETEKIDLTFNTKPRTGLGLTAGTVINPFIKVGGTFMHPAVAFDAAGAVIGGGAAVATLGLSLLAKSFFDRFVGSKDPCGDARKKLEKADSKSG